MAIIIDFTGFMENIRDAMIAGLMDFYDQEQINLRAILAADQSSEWIEIYLAPTLEVPTNLNTGKSFVSDVTLTAQIRCVSPNPDTLTAMKERDLLVGRARQALYTHKTDFNLSGLTVIDIQTDDLTDENLAEGIMTATRLIKA